MTARNAPTARTVLVTGASGVVGSAVLHALDGDRVIALTHRKPAPGRTVRGDATRPWLGLAPAEYRELAAMVDVVVHCAALVNFTAEPQVLHNLNVRGVGHILQFVDDAGARLVHGSTAFIDRARPHGTITAYAASKAAGETLVRESGLPSATARISTVVGDSRTGALARLQAFHYLVGMAMYGNLPFLPYQEGVRVDIVPVDVVAAALAALARSDTARGEHWITAGDAALPIQEVIDIGCEVVAEHFRNDPTLPGLDPSLLKTRLIERSVYEQVISTILAGAAPDATPGIIGSIPALMDAFNATEHFPTSLGTIPGGPPPLSPTAVSKALRATCRHLVSLPRETWQLHP